MLTTAILVLLALATVSATLIMAIIFANKFAVLCLSLLTGYVATLAYLAVRGRKDQQVVVVNQELLLPHDREMMLRRVS